MPDLLDTQTPAADAAPQTPEAPASSPMFFLAGEDGGQPIPVDRHNLGAEDGSEEETPTPAKPSEEGGVDGDPARDQVDAKPDPADDADKKDKPDEAPSTSGITQEAHSQRVEAWTAGLTTKDPEAIGLLKELSADDIYEHGLSQLEFLVQLSSKDPADHASVLQTLGATISRHVSSVGPDHFPEALTEEDCIKIAEMDDLSDFELRLLNTVNAAWVKNAQLLAQAKVNAEGVKEVIARSVKNQTDATILGTLKKAFPSTQFDVEEVRKLMVEYSVASPVHAVTLSQAGSPDTTTQTPADRTVRPGGTPTPRVITKAERPKLTAGDIYERLMNGEVLEE